VGGNDLRSVAEQLVQVGDFPQQAGQQEQHADAQQRPARSAEGGRNPA